MEFTENQFKKRKILIVDDDSLLRQALVTDFVRRGHEAQEASDGKQALDLLKMQSFDLVISDVKMPKLDGAELLAQIRTNHKELPVFMFITGFTEMTLEDAYNKGASALFSKPFRRQALFKAVEWALLPKVERWKEPVPRLSTDFAIEMVVKGFPRPVDGQMLNIGRGGMFVSLNPPFPPIGEAVDFNISFEQVAPFRLAGQGIVRWIRGQAAPGKPCGCGIEFLNFAANSLPEALHLIETFQPLPFIPEI